MPDALTDELIELHKQLLARDTAFRAWDERVEALEREKEELAREMSLRLNEAAAQIRELSETITGMQATGIWRLGQRHWTMREWFKRRCAAAADADQTAGRNPSQRSRSPIRRNASTTGREMTLSVEKSGSTLVVRRLLRIAKYKPACQASKPRLPCSVALGQHDVVALARAVASGCDIFPGDSRRSQSNDCDPALASSRL